MTEWSIPNLNLMGFVFITANTTPSWCQPVFIAIFYDSTHSILFHFLFLPGNVNLVVTFLALESKTSFQNASHP